MAFAQERQGETISVAGTVSGEGTPIPYAHVYLQNRNIGTVTNTNGEFVLRVPAGFNLRETKVTISCIGFVSAEVLLYELIQSRQTIALIAAGIELPEITVTGGPDSAMIFFENAIDRIKFNYPRKRHLLEAFYRELSIKDAIYTRLIEAAILVDEPGYKGNTVNSDDLSLTRNKVQLIELRKSEDNRDYDLLGWAYSKIFGEKNDIYEILNDNYTRFIGKNNEHFLSKKFLKEYDFQIEETTFYEGHPVVVISLNSKDKDIFFLRNVLLYINKEDYGIVKIENNLIVNPSRKEILKYAIDQKYFYQSVIIYEKFEHFYVPYYIRTRKYASNTNPLNNNSLQYSDVEFLLTNFFYDDYERIKSRHVLKRDQDINKSDAKYNEEFWKNYSTVILNPISGKSKKDLEKKKTLEEQFKKN